MTTYTTIPNSDIDQDSPVTQPLLTLMRDNPIAITEGASGAPRIRDAAMDTTPTDAGRDWVRSRYALTQHNTIGAVCFAVRTTSNTNVIQPGTSVLGSQLKPSNAVGDSITGVSALSGTWRFLGAFPAVPGLNAGRTTLFLRIA